MLNEEKADAGTVKDLADKNSKIEAALQKIFGSIEKEAMKAADVKSEGLGDVLKNAIDPNKNPVLKMINKSKLMSSIMAVLGLASETPPHEISFESMVQGLTDPKPDVLELMSDYIDPSNLETIMQLVQQIPMEETLEDQIVEAVMDLLDEKTLTARTKEKAASLKGVDPKTGSTTNLSPDEGGEEIAKIQQTAAGEDAQPTDDKNKQAVEGIMKVIEVAQEKGIVPLAAELKQKQPAMKSFLAAIKQLGGVEKAPEAAQLGDDEKKLFTDLIAALQAGKSPNKEVDKMKVSMQKINKLIEDRKDIFFAVEGSFAQVRKMAFVPKPVEGQEPTAFLSGEQSVKLSELGVDPKNLKGDLGSVIVVRSKDLYNVRKIQKEAPEDNVVDIVPINNQKELDDMFSGTKLNDQGGPLEGSGLFFVKDESEEMAPVGDAQDQTSELDISKAQEKYGKALEGILEGEELTLIIKFLALLMKDDLLSENLRDVLKGIGLGGGKIATAIKAGQDSGVFTQDEIKKVSAIFKNNPEKTKKFIAAITQTSKPQEKEKTTPEEGAFKKEAGEKTEGLAAALDKFMGEPAGDEPNFLYPQSNLLKDQGQMLAELYSKIRILLDLETPEMHRELLALNRRNLGKLKQQQADQSKEEPAADQATKPETTEPAPGKRDIYEVKTITSKDAKPQDLVLLRDYIKDAIATVQLYLDVAKEGKRGSKELYSKYGNELGQKAYEPKTVLYQVNLKNIVNLCNTFLNRIEPELKAKPKDTEAAQDQESEEQLQEQKREPIEQIIAKVEKVFNFVVDKGSRLKEMIVDHAEITNQVPPAADADNQGTEGEAEVQKEEQELTADQVKKVEPAVASIRQNGEAIHTQLKTIKQYFPLVNPFESDLYGDKGFKEAINTLKSMLKDLVAISSQMSGVGSFGEVSSQAKRALFNVLERIVKNIKDTFAGEFDERPALNPNTNEDEFKDKAPKIGGEKDEPEVDDPEAEETTELSSYLSQEEDFYKRVVRIRDKYGEGGLSRMQLQEVDIKEPIKFLGDLRAKIEDYEEQLKDEDLRADKFKFRQAMKIYKEYLDRYIDVYEQFKQGNLELSFAQTPEEKAGLREKQLKLLQDVLEEYKIFWEHVSAFNGIVNSGKPTAEQISPSLDALVKAADAKGKVTKVPAQVNSATKSVSSDIKKQEERGEKALKQKSNVTDLINTGPSALERIISSKWFTAGIAAAGALTGAAAAGMLSEKEEDEATPEKDVADDLLDDPVMDAAAENFEALEGIGKEFADLMIEFDTNYRVGQFMIDNIIDYSKQLKDVLAKIATKAKEIRRMGLDLYKFISKNKDLIYESLIKVAKIELPEPPSVKDDEPAQTDQTIEDKYKSELDVVESGKERETLIRLLKKLQAIGEEILQERKWLGDIIENTIDLFEDETEFTRQDDEFFQQGDPKATPLRSLDDKDFEGTKDAKPKASSFEELVTAILGSNKMDSLKQGDDGLSDSDIELLKGMFTKYEDLAANIIKTSGKKAEFQTASGSTPDPDAPEDGDLATTPETSEDPTKGKKDESMEDYQKRIKEMTNNLGLHLDAGSSGHAKVANISPTYIVLQYADGSQVRYGGTEQSKDFDMGKYWKEIYEDGKNANGALTQGPPTKGFTDEKGVHTWVDGEPNTEKTGDDPSPVTYTIPEIETNQIEQLYRNSELVQTDMDGFFKPNLPKFINFLGELKSDLSESAKNDPDQIITNIGKQAKKADLQGFFSNKVLEKYKNHPDKTVIGVFLKLFAGKNGARKLKPIWDSIEKENIEGGQPPADKKKMRAKKQQRQLASPSPAGVAKTDEALVNKLKPIIREMMRGNYG